MKNIFFPEEEITENDLFFVCSMIERVARQVKQRNKYVVNKIGYQGFLRQLSIADTLHCENPQKVADDWKHDFQLEQGDFDITKVDPDLCSHIPTPHDMGKVYTRLILQTRLDEEDYAKGIIRVYNDDLCETIDNYNCSAYYEPSYYIARSYFAGGFV
jgi:hypothetical protein